MMILFRFSFFGAVCAALPAADLTIDDAIRTAWRNDPVLAVFDLDPDIARARAELAGLRPNPEVTYRGDAALTNSSEWSVGVGVQQRLPRRERVERAQKQARLEGEGALWRAHERRRILAGEVRRLCYEAAVHRETRDGAERAALALRQLAEKLAARKAAGEVPAWETEVLALEQERAEQTLTLAEAELAGIRERLRARLRLPAGASVELQTDLSSLLDRPVPPAPAWLNEARPATALAQHEVRQAEGELALARAQRRPDWTVGAGLDFERRASDLDGRLENEPRLSVHASVPWPRPNASRVEVREKQAGLKKAEAALKSVREELETEIAAALGVARTLHGVVQAYRASLARSSGVPSALQAAFERGEVSAAQLAQVRQQRFSLEADYLAAASRYVAALAEAETAVGLMPRQP